MAKATVTISAENTYSSKFHLSGDGAGWARRCLVCATRDDSTVTLRRYAPDCPGSLLEVQEWTKPVTKRDIDKVSP